MIIAGSREFKNYSLLKSVLDTIIGDRTNIEIVSGCANGADKLGEKYAEEKGFKIEKFPADWDYYKKSAGFIRNKEMAIYSHCLIAFWDKKSRGTLSMIKLAKEYKLKIKIICY